MKFKFFSLIAAAALVLATSPVMVRADGLTFTPTLTGYQQTTNNPCVIGDPSCNEPSGMTYYSSSGPQGTYDFTSPLYTATDPHTTYSGNLIPVSFMIGVDENIAKGAGNEVLQFFYTWDCGTDGLSCTLDSANSYLGPTIVPNENNGNGYSDYTLSTLNLTAGNMYKFEASVSNDTDGMEEYFIIPAGTPTPVPEPGSLMLFGTGLLGMAGFLRRKLPL
jgi:hypothetical protein